VERQSLCSAHSSVSAVGYQLHNSTQQMNSLRTSQYAQLVNKLPVFYGTEWFTRDRHRSVFWATTNPLHVLKSDFPTIHFNIILLSTPRPSDWSPRFRLSNQNDVLISYLLRPTWPFQLIFFDLIILIISGE
jgi:hypothetical protein